jgi:hypothetical protein
LADGMMTSTQGTTGSARVERLEHLDPDAAAECIANGDRTGERFVKAHFHKRVKDDLLYHLIINTGRIPIPDAARLIADGARRCFRAGAQDNLGHGTA